MVDQRRESPDKPDTGWINSDVVNAGLAPLETITPTLPEQTRAFYQKILKIAQQKGVKVIALMPCIYATEHYQKQLPKLALELTQLGIPVIKDATFGVMRDAVLFTDLAQHPNAQGAEIYTRRVGEALSKQQFWTEAELEALIEPAEQPKL